jgi:ATP-dependent Clp protease, protease subunit
MSIDLPGVPDRFTNNLYTQEMDISNRLLRERIIVLGKEVDDEVANQTIALLLHLDAEDPEKDIRLQINCPGGSIAGLLAIVLEFRLRRLD